MWDIRGDIRRYKLVIIMSENERIQDDKMTEIKIKRKFKMRIWMAWNDRIKHPIQGLLQRY